MNETAARWLPLAIQTSQSAADALWWSLALGIPSPDGRHRAPNLIPFSADRVPRRRGWSAYAHRGDPQIPHGTQRSWLARAATDPSLYAWALLPGQAGLVVVDVDDPVLLPDLLALYGDTPVKVRTPRGGAHLYYLAPPADGGRLGDLDGPAVQSRTGVRGDHSYDVKADGQPCHVPMQRHHVLSDARYEADVPGGWRGPRWAVGELRALLPAFRADVAAAEWAAHNPVPETPDDLEERVLACTPAEMDAGRAYCAAAGPAVSGNGGHEHTRRLILKLGDLGYPYEAGLELLREWNGQLADPWSDDDLVKKTKHYYRQRNLPIGWRADPSASASDLDEPDEYGNVTPELTTAELTRALTDEGLEHARMAAYEARLVGGGPAEVAAAAAAVASRDTARVVVGEVFGARGLPHVDVDDLFADLPVVHDQCLAVQQALRMSSADVPALFALGFVSAALAARCRIDVAPRFRPPPHLFVVASVPSGRGKSAALSRMGESLTRQWQDDLGAEWEAIAQAASVQRGIAKSTYADYERQAVRLRKAIDDGAGVGADALQQHAQQVSSLATVVQRMERLTKEIADSLVSKPVWIQADSTPEKFADLVKEHGFALLMAAEGSAILQAFTQGYTGNNRITGLLSGYTGEALDRARVGDGKTTKIERFAEMHACMILPVQSFLLEPGGGLADRERSNVLRELASSGFFARCLVAREEVTGVCQAPAEFDDTWVAAASKATARHDVAQAAWDDLLSDVWGSGYRAPPATPLAPSRGEQVHAIVVEPEALVLLERFQSWAQEQAKPTGRWVADRVAESAARIGEQAMRVAAILAVMRARSCIGVRVSLDEARRAVRFCKDYAMPIIEHLIERAKPDPIADDAEIVRRKTIELQEVTVGDVTRRALQIKLGRGWGKSTGNDKLGRLDAAIEHLEVIGVMTVHRTARGTIGSVKILPAKS